jgi:NADP-dependent 3-hydroxy acid dehydrogenase YdfG
LCLQAEFGRLDVLVNNAGFTWDGVIHKMGDKQWQVRIGTTNALQPQCTLHL